MKVMLVTKHPDIKDQSKKIRVTNWKFKYKSINDVFPPEEPHSPQPAKESIWRRLLSDGDAKEFDRKVKYRAPDDVNIPIEDKSNESVEGEDKGAQNDIEYTSKNKILQQKYNEGFLSNIVSTGTVSLVTEYAHHKVINRAKMLMTEDRLSDDSDVETSKILTFKLFEHKSINVYYKKQFKEIENPTTKDVKRAIAADITGKMMRKLHIGNHSKMSHNSSGSFTSKTLQNSKVSGPKKMNSTEKEKKLPSVSSGIVVPKKLQRRGTIVHEE